MTAPRFVVGIDLGTTHTVVAYANLMGDTPSAVFAIPQLVTAATSEARPLLPSLLYAPLDIEALRDPWSEPPWVTGEVARRRGAEVPGRLVASAKSWLCHAAVDRTAAILPWGEGDHVPKISPGDASSHYLAHVRRAWDQAHPDAPLASQDVVLTVPASFDEVARELTVEAAERAGLTVRLLEEPLAAFYDYRARAGDAGLAALAGSGDPAPLVLVCDVGGGTTDLSLLRVSRTHAASDAVAVTRIAVGRHLLLGGDNMDLALAHACEARLGDSAGGALDPARHGQLLLACRAAKEALLADEGPAEVAVSIASSGSQLVGAVLRTRLTREEVAQTVIDGFFPPASRAPLGRSPRGGLVGFGLPYERDVAITRHLAAFFERHADGASAPRALLLNGGVFHARAIAQRLVQTVDSWGGPPVVLLPQADPDLAVARGAVTYGLARARGGPTVASGSARGYYVEVASERPHERAVVCVVPRGTEEGVVARAALASLALVVGRPARFDLFASDNAQGHRAGDRVAWADVELDPLPPLFTTLPTRTTPAALDGRRVEEETVRVALEGELSAVGTLDLACVEVDAPPGAAPRRFRLGFSVREGAASSPRGGPLAPVPRAPGVPSARPPPALRLLDEARLAIDRIYGRSARDVSPRDAKDLPRELERLLGDRARWDVPTTRALYDALFQGHKARRRSKDHERVFWQLAGYCLRPGVGDPRDPPRVASLVRLFEEKLTFADEPRTWQQFWFAWRRVAMGLDEPTQIAFRNAVDPHLAVGDPPRSGRAKGKGSKPDALDALLEMASCLERLPHTRRAELGAWVIERTWTDRDPRLWTALGRLGARVPAYAAVNFVLTASSVERWVDHLLREKWQDVPTAADAALRLARVTGDRSRDLPERLRKEVAQRLLRVDVPAQTVRAVLEFVPEDFTDTTTVLGDEVPLGLRLVHSEP